MMNDNKNPKDSFEIRMGQTGGFGFAPNKRWPNAYMGAAFDLSNPPGTKCVSGCIHIFNKQAAAHRLALAARSMIYKEKIVYAGPRVSSVKAAGGTVTVTYDAIGTEGLGIKLRTTDGMISPSDSCPVGSHCSGFEASNGQIWFEGNATSATNNTVTVKFPVTAGVLTELRYCIACIVFATAHRSSSLTEYPPPPLSFSLSLW
jgi:hypothetical protein